MLNSASETKSRNLDDLNDVLIVRKITAPDDLSIEDDSREEIFEQNLSTEEQEVLCQKELQLLEADERGRVALAAEIRAIRERQEGRERVLRQRQHALHLERERARKVARLPPPLPASVKLLLRKKGNGPDPENPEVQMPHELQVSPMKGSEMHRSENKENVLTEEEMEAKQRVREEWQKRAQKRFHEAIRKDRKREEYTKVMKEIQNAELLNRREIAKSIVSENKSVPCPLSDKFHMVQKQADIEAASERIFKKMDEKEHAIEDIEGYRDSYDEVFGRIDSGFESKMIDCVPSFVKENYEYLLEDDSQFEGGRHFTGLDDTSSDPLNEAYIESSPDYERLSGSEKLDEAINHLDRLRTNIQMEYEQTLRPLLEAAIEAPKKDTSDKAVEAKILKLPAEDKAVGTEIPADSPPLPTSNFLNMAFKRRHERPRLGSYSQLFVPPMRQRDVHYPGGGPPSPERLTPTSWSSSSYCSLPWRHGIPTASSGSAKCDICVAEEEGGLAKSTAALPREATPPDGKKSDASATSRERSKLTEYVQLLAAKYLAPRRVTEFQSDSALSLKSLAQSVSAAFEREVVPKFREVSVTRPKSDEHPWNAADKPVPVTMADKKASMPNAVELSAVGDVLDEIVEKINNEKKESDITENPDEVSRYNEENAMRFVQQILGQKIPRFTLDSTSPAKAEDRQQPAPPHMSGQDPVSSKPYVFHELSTIHEMDSALTAGSLYASRSKLSSASAVSAEEETTPDRNLESSRERIRTASLLDPPDPKVTDIAKNIHFVGRTQKEVVHPVTEPSPVISPNAQDSASVMLKKNLSVPSSFLSGPSISCDSVRSTNRPHLKNSRLLPHFLEGSDIRPEDFNSEISGLSSLTPGLLSSKLSSPSTLSGTPLMKTTGNIGSLTTGLFSSDLSSSVSLTGLTTPSMKSAGNVGSLESGYTNSPVFTTSLCPANVTSGASLVISPAVSSIHFTPTLIESKSCRNEDQLSLLKSGSSSGFGKSGAHGLKRFQSITPHFDISVPSSVRGGGEATTPQSGIPDPRAVSKSSEQQSMAIHFDFPSRSVARESPELQPVTYSNYSEQLAGRGNAEFLPMTPHSDFPSLSVRSESLKFQPMTPQSDFPSIGSASAKFQPMTPLSDFPSVGKFQPKTGPAAANKSAEFRPMTPHSNFPSSSEWSANFGSNFEEQDTHAIKEFVQHRKEMAPSSSSESFALLTPHSSISTPSQENVVNPDFQGNDRRAENFRNMTSVSTSKAAVIPKSTPSGSSNFYPMKIRIDVLSDSASSKDGSSSSTNNFPQLNYRLTVKAPLPDDMHYADSIAETKPSNISPKIPTSDSLNLAGKMSSRPKANLCGKVCPSGYFTPHIEKHQEVELRTDIDKKCRETEFKHDSKPSSSGADFQRGPLKSKKLAAASSGGAENIIEYSHTKDLWGKAEAARPLNKPLGHLQLMSSASSSSENLSEISGSKVLHQSTPIKSAEQIAQEPGILEESDLTLMTTEYSCLANTTTKPHQVPIAADERPKILPSEECRTPSHQSFHLIGSTPSLLSFLQHELSCEDADTGSIKLTPAASENKTDSKDTGSIKLTPAASENKTDSKEKAAGRNFKYKERTKRLWNNLEEVRKKKEFEERKKHRTESRLKAKEYAKKLTPIRK